MSPHYGNVQYIFTAECIAYPVHQERQVSQKDDISHVLKLPWAPLYTLYILHEYRIAADILLDQVARNI